MRGSGVSPAERRLAAILSAMLAAAGMVVVSSPARVAAEQAPRAPSITVQPFCWQQGESYTLTVSANSLAPNRDVKITDYEWYGFADLQSEAASTTATTDAYGTLTATLQVTPTTGANTVAAAYANDATVLATFPFAPCNNTTPATARIVAPCGDANAVPSIHVVGAGWAASPSDATINFFLFGTTGYDFTIGPTASFDVTFPPQPAGGPPLVAPTPTPSLPPSALAAGDYRLDITQYSSDGTVDSELHLPFHVPCPQVTVTPTCAQVGAPTTTLPISLSGSGFDDNSYLQIVFDPGGEPQQFIYPTPPPPASPAPTGYGVPTPSPSPPPLPTGSLSSVEIDPYARPAGTYTIEVLQYDANGGVIRDWTTTFAVPCYAPTIAADPGCGPPEVLGQKQRYAITVHGTSFAPNQPITVTFDADASAGSSYPPETFSDETDGDGVINTAIDVAYRPPGSYRIVAYQDLSIGHVEASTAFTVPCPTQQASLAVSPSCEPAADGQSAAYTLNLTGGGFLPGTVNVVLDPNGAPFTGTVTADVSGYISAPFVVDGRPAGTYEVDAYQDNNGVHIEASTTLTVPCAAPATLTIDPTCGPAAAGQTAAYTVNAVGAGFAPGDVELLFDPTSSEAVASTVQADASGAFSSQLVGDGKPPGVYDVVASQVDGYGLRSEVSAQFLVPCNLVVLRITPTAGSRGFVPLVEGFGFPPLTTLTLRWDHGIGASQPVTVTTDATGSFSRQVLIFQYDFTGMRHLTVQSPSDPTAYATISADYFVSPATVSPPFLIDNPFGPPEPIVLRR